MNVVHPHILALARSGAASRAWAAFVAAGLDQVAGNPATLTLKGRLLKDRARKATGDVSARLYLQSAKAYADAAALRPDSYPLINAATMSLFAGQPSHMALLAQKVLTMLDTGMGLGETPYWHEATRAEALLLLDRKADAQAALNRAIIAAPQAWEDRAATLRQFRQIAEFRNQDSGWLSNYAPPASLYFKGMIGVAADDMRGGEMAHEAVTNANAGFGYGALAAGADILIAEALIDVGAELHLILPVFSSAFRAQSVAPYGKAWLPRFDRLFEQAASVTVAATGDRLTEAAIGFAAQVAKGAAMENAGRLEGRTIGLELNDQPSPVFERASDLFVSLARSAPHPAAALNKGVTLVTLVSDDVGDDRDSWMPVADGFYAHNAKSVDAVNALLIQLKKIAPGARSSVSISAVENRADAADAHMAKALRLAQCAAAGTSIADVSSARAILSACPKLRIEPLGELPGTGGATEIYAIEPMA